MRIQSINQYRYCKQIKNTDSSNKHVSYPNNSTAFKAKVSKDIQRFYNFNINRLPYTVEKYARSLGDISNLTPLTLQNMAFACLGIVSDINDIKELYGDEPLFKNLSLVEQSKASTGIIKCINDNKEILALDGKGALKTGDDFTVYLVKKIFLEAKTINEINKDLENDLDDDLKIEFRRKYGNEARYIHSSTLNALGIKMPIQAYFNSLKFTKPGYADEFALKASIAQLDYWRSLSPEQRTEKAKKSLFNFEKWWLSLSHEEKINLLAEQDSVLAVLSQFKKDSNKSISNNENIATSSKKEVIDKQNNKIEHVKVVSDVFSKDELFKQWAKNNLKIFEAQLSESQKEELKNKRIENQINRWRNMTSAEKTECISKLKASAERFSFVMIDAWNNSPEIIVELSKYLKENQIFKPVDLLYSTKEFATLQSQVMSEFWDKNPELARLLGDNMIASYKRINTAINNGCFSTLQQEILNEKKARIENIENILTPKKPSIVPDKSIEDILIETYKKTPLGQLKPIPDDYYKDYFGRMVQLLNKDTVITWIKTLAKENVTAEEQEILRNELQNAQNDVLIKRYNHALEFSLAEALCPALSYDFWVYELNLSEIKTILSHLDEDKIKIKRNDIELNFKTDKSKMDFDLTKIQNNFNRSKQDLTALDKHLVYRFFPSKNPLSEQDNNILSEYFDSYGQCLNKFLSRKSAYPPDAKIFMYQNFIDNFPASLKEKNIIEPLYVDGHHFGYEESEIQKLETAFVKKYPFIPREVATDYINVIGYYLLHNDDDDIDSYIEQKLGLKDNYESEILNLVDKEKSFDGIPKLRMLALEQALADAMYEATKDELVYQFYFEHLIAAIRHQYTLFKPFSNQLRGTNNQVIEYNDSDGNTHKVTIYKKINEKLILSKYKHYLDEICNYMNENQLNMEQLDQEEMLYILNPEDGNPIRDKNTISRLEEYGIGQNK